MLSLPPSVIHFPLEQAVKTVRQKRYRLPDGRVMETTEDISKVEQATEPDATEPGWSKELDKMLEGLDVGAENGSNIKQERRLISSERTVNVMMPDRSVPALSTMRIFAIRADGSCTDQSTLQSPAQYGRKQSHRGLRCAKKT